MYTYTGRNAGRCFVVTFCVVSLAAGVLLYHTNTFGTEIVQNKFKLNFIPEKYKRCEDLLLNSSIYGIQLSQMNKLKSKELGEAVRNATRGQTAEGHSGQIKGEYF